MFNSLEKYFSPYFVKIKELIPKAKAKTSVGLDIGTSSVKVVRINNLAGNHEIDAFAIEPVVNDDVAAAIIRAMEKSGIETKAVNTSVSGQGVVIRYVLMPKMPLADIKSSISLESDKYFPFPLEDVVMDCCILEERPEENKVIVLVAAAKKDLVEQRVALFSNLELEAETIYTDSIAMANLFNVLGSSISKDDMKAASERSLAVAVINIGATSSNLNIIKDNLPRFTRDIFSGGLDFTRRISNIFGLNMKSAEGLKTAPGDQKAKVLEACESVLNNLLTETRLSFDYFETENNIPVSLLYLSGGGSGLLGLDEIMKQNLAIEVKPLQPFLGLTVNPKLSEDNLTCSANKLSIAIGSALK